ncbi:MAG: hypothetical protein DMG25_10265 [Acidobacteria bacterium]|nr:MAG: hypothetical protein DMG25_10265 [Acidobacteriota bacterium]PYV22358.1 MAG: hypothetical protein DMG27_18385 [Acidobacteriota bacterium]
MSILFFDFFSNLLEPETNIESGIRPLVEFERDCRPRRKSRLRSAHPQSQTSKNRGLRQPGERTREKGANFRGNKATIWFRMSELTQKWPKNKANFV